MIPATARLSFSLCFGLPVCVRVCVCSVVEGRLDVPVTSRDCLLPSQYQKKRHQLQEKKRKKKNENPDFFLLESVPWAANNKKPRDMLPTAHTRRTAQFGGARNGATVQSPGVPLRMRSALFFISVLSAISICDVRAVPFPPLSRPTQCTITQLRTDCTQHTAHRHRTLRQRTPSPNRLRCSLISFISVFFFSYSSFL